jgi:hypothetical protein
MNVWASATINILEPPDVAVFVSSTIAYTGRPYNPWVAVLQPSFVKSATHSLPAIVVGFRVLGGICGGARISLFAAKAHNRRHFKLLDVRGKLAFEDGERVIFASCKLGKRRLLQMPISPW